MQILTLTYGDENSFVQLELSDLVCEASSYLTLYGLQADYRKFLIGNKMQGRSCLQAFTDVGISPIF